MSSVAAPRRRLPGWPRSLQGQMLLAIAVALLVAQGISAAVIWRMQQERHLAGVANAAAFRLLGRLPAFPGSPRDPGPPPFDPPPGEAGGPPQPGGEAMRVPRPLRLQVAPQPPAQAGDIRRPDVEQALRELLAAQGLSGTGLVVVEREPARDAETMAWPWGLRRFQAMRGGPPRLLLAALRRPGGDWLIARVLVPPTERAVIVSLLLQTILLYLVLVGAVALILGRIARPLRALTVRVETFARQRSVEGQLAPEGPDDVRGLIAAHNAMESRIAALLDEKDVMLGAIGHDLKTPLAALRVRIEAVDDEAERARMAATIEDIARSLDDILSLARVGRPSDPVEPTELAALVADVVGEFEDMGEDVELAEGERIVLPVRATWLRRALRNLVSNALRYGKRARVSLSRDGGGVVLRVDDDGPGIPEHEIARMLEPFTRLEASRNSATGGTGLGLALARAIAEQHGGALVLANRPDGGLRATLRLPSA